VDGDALAALKIPKEVELVVIHVPERVKGFQPDHSRASLKLVLSQSQLPSSLIAGIEHLSKKKGSPLVWWSAPYQIAPERWQVDFFLDSQVGDQKTKGFGDQLQRVLREHAPFDSVLVTQPPMAESSSSLQSIQLTSDEGFFRQVRLQALSSKKKVVWADRLVLPTTSRIDNSVTRVLAACKARPLQK
jgi:hypothetical protein